jgi:RNA polymerase sigma factor (sigma-70 family)
MSKVATDESIIRDIRRVPRITANENLELARKVRAGGPDAQAARDRMIAGNLRLVLVLARRHGHPTMALGDRVQEGTFGLMRAIEKFDPDRGVSFATYASYWIRACIDRARANSEGEIRLPGNVGAGVRRLRRIENSLNYTLSEEERRSILSIGNTAYRAVQQMPQMYISLNAIIPYSDLDGEGHTPEESIADETNVSQDDAVAFDEIHDVLEKAGIAPRELKITKAYFTGSSLEEIGNSIGISRERVRQLINMTLVQLRKYMTKARAKS